MKHFGKNRKGDGSTAFAGSACNKRAEDHGQRNGPVLRHRLEGVWAGIAVPDTPDNNSQCNAEKNRLIYLSHSLYGEVILNNIHQDSGSFRSILSPFPSITIYWPLVNSFMILLTISLEEPTILASSCCVGLLLITIISPCFTAIS